MPDRTGLVLCSLDVSTVMGPGVEGQGTPVEQVVKVVGMEADPAAVAAFLRSVADRLDGRGKPGLPGHKPGCRCAPSATRGGPQGDGRAVDRE